MERSFVSLFITLAAAASCFAQIETLPTKPQKIAPDELIAKHIASIGTPEALAAAKTRVFAGEGSVHSTRGYIGSLSGRVQLASTDDSMLFVMLFNSNDYPYEKAAFDGQTSSVGLPNGNRTALANFLKSKSVILKDGLFGGALCSGWPPVNLKAKKSKVEFGGIVKIGGRDLYKLKYSPRGETLRVSLFFDTQNFRHVMTQYQYTVDIRIGTSSTDIPTVMDYYTLTEQFDDFKKAGDLTLPFLYTITLDVEHNGTAGGTRDGRLPTGAGSLTYTLKLKQVYFNQQLEAGMFKVS
jgi:hypothetical protein